MNERLPVQAIQDEATPLQYAPKPVEFALFRFLAWLFLITGAVQILPLFSDALALRHTQLPNWVTVLWGLTGWRLDWRSQWVQGWSPMLQRLLPLLLIAAAVGMLRRNALSRPWALVYAVTAICVLGSTRCADIIANAWRWRGSAPYSYYERDVTGFLRDLGNDWLNSLPPILLLYLMTRPYVRSLYRGRGAD